MLRIYQLHNFNNRKYYFFLTHILFNIRKIELNSDSENVRFMLHFGFDNLSCGDSSSLIGIEDTFLSTRFVTQMLIGTITFTLLQHVR